MPIYVVAVEYQGADLPPHRGARRRPLWEHAYDLTTGQLAHGGNATRIGFPEPTRGWPRPPRSPRCPTCTLNIADVISAVVTHAINQLNPISTPARPNRTFWPHQSWEVLRHEPDQ